MTGDDLGEARIPGRGEHARPNGFMQRIAYTCVAGALPPAGGLGDGCAAVRGERLQFRARRLPRPPFRTMWRPWIVPASPSCRVRPPYGG